MRTAADNVADYEQPFHEAYYLLGSVVGPHPYPWLVRELQSVIGFEARIFSAMMRE